jgi:transcriptional regulator with XRE-family HTH domain
MLGWSQTELADETGKSLSTIKRLERLAVQKALEKAGVEFISENGGALGCGWRNAASERNNPSDVAIRL